MAMQAPPARMTEDEYRAFALGDEAGQWELVGGELREKPGKCEPTNNAGLVC